MANTEQQPSRSLVEVVESIQTRRDLMKKMVTAQRRYHETEKWFDDVTEFCDYVLRWMQAREQGVPYYNGL